MFQDSPEWNVEWSLAYYHVPHFGLMHCRLDHTANRKSKCLPYPNIFHHSVASFECIGSHSHSHRQWSMSNKIAEKFVFDSWWWWHLRRLHSDFVALFSFLVDFSIFFVQFRIGILLVLLVLWNSNNNSQTYKYRLTWFLSTQTGQTDTLTVYLLLIAFFALLLPPPPLLLFYFLIFFFFWFLLYISINFQAVTSTCLGQLKWSNVKAANNLCAFKQHRIVTGIK